MEDDLDEFANFGKRKNTKITDSDLAINKKILVDSLIKIIETTNNLQFKYNLLGKLKLNHLSSKVEIEAVLNNLLDRSISYNSGEKNKKMKTDPDFDELDDVKIEENDSDISFLSSSFQSDFSELGELDLKSKNFEPKNHNSSNILNNNDFDHLENISTIKQNDDFETILDF